METQDHTDILYENQKTKNVFTKSDIVSGVNIDGAYLEIWEILVDEQGNILKNPDGSYKLADEAVDAWVSQYDGEDLHYYYEKDGFYFEIGAPDELPEGEDLITKEGHLIENLIVGKQYLLRETLAPENYVGYEASYDETKEANKDVNEITEEVMFIVTNDNIVAEHDMKDQRTVGTFSVTKEGEFFVGTEKDLKFTDKVKNLFMTVFNYLFGRVENAAFEIYVRDDIFTPDKTGDLAEWTNAAGDTLQLTKDTLIETITTSDHGIATIENLPLGTYYIKEVGAGDGDFLLNPDIKDVTLSYVDQDTPVVFATDTPYVNDRQKVEITMEKKRINDEGKKETVQGAVFGLYAEEALYGYVISGEKVVTPYNDPYVLQDQLLETIESDGEGKAVFQADLPCGKYYVKEIQPADGYLKNPKTYHFDASYTGQEGDKVLTFAQEVINTITEVYIDKQDITNDKEISGAHLQVIEKDSEEIIDSWTSDGKSHEIEGLKLSDDEENVYILRETLPADGFVTANDIEFKLYQDKDPEGNWLQTHSVQVLDVEEEEHQEGTVISQAAFSDQQDIMADSVKGNVIANWIFKDGVLDITFTGNATQAAIDKTLREKDFADMEIRKVVFHNGSAEGFYPDKVVPGKPMEIASTSKWVTVDKNTVIMKDDITKIRISKYDITSSDEVLGAKLQIIDQDGNVVEEWISGEEPHYIERLPVGDYTLREIQAPTENGYVHTEDLKFRVDDTGNIQSVYLPDNYTKLQIKKTDIATGEPVIGAELQIVQIIKNPDGTESEKVLESWITTEEDHYSDRLPVGDYYLVEIKAPIEDGYVTAERIRFTVEEDYHIKLVEMKDDYTRVRVDKTDKNLQMLMEGAVLELYALSEKEDKLVASWTSSSSEGYYIERLPVGTYKIVETSAPEGYKIAEPIIFEVKDTVGVQVVVFENEMIADFVKLVVEKSTIEKTQVNDTFKYTIDTIHNASAVLMDEFTVTDTLPVEVRLTELYTGTYNEDYLFDVLYRTNKEPEWKVWESGLSTLKNNKLLVADIPLEDEEYVTEFRMAFGTVRSQFKNVETPEYLVKVVDWGDGELINDIVLTGVKYGVTHSDKDQTVTTLYKKDISGKKPHGGSHPKYEITGSEMDENTLLKLQYPWLANSPQTGDMAPVAPLAALCIVALAGIGIYIWRKKKK